MDIGLVAASIACMSADTFAEILLDQRFERVFGRQIKAVEGVVCRFKAPCQRTCVVALRRGDLLVLDL